MKGDDVVEQQHEVHSRALSRESQSGKAEMLTNDLGPVSGWQAGASLAASLPGSDSAVSWGRGGETTASTELNDTPISPAVANAGGVSPQALPPATAPALGNSRPAPDCRGGASGMDAILAHTSGVGGRK